MNTYGSRQVRCAVCGTESEQLRVDSAESFGWPDLDLRPPERRRSTMQAWLQECPSCGFVAADLSKVSDAEIAAISGPEAEPTWKEMLADRSESGPLSLRFDRRAFIERQMHRYGLAGFRMLCAAWDADDRNDTQSAIAYRAEAATLLETALTNRPDAKEATDWTVQLVDILRRLGKWDAAADYCERLVGNSEPRIDAIGRFQARAIVDEDSGRYTMGGAMEDDEDG